MQRVAAAVLDRGPEDVQQGRFATVQVEEDGSAPQVFLGSVQGVTTDRLEQGMAGL